MYRSAEEIERQYHRTMAQHRKEQRTRKHRSVGIDEPQFGNGIRPHVLYAYRRGVWVLVAFVRRAPTRKRLAKWRLKYRVKSFEVVCAKSLWEAQRNGPPTGAPAGLGTFAQDWPGGGHVPHHKPIDEQWTPVMVMPKKTVRGTPDMPRCSHGKGTRHHCKRKGTWIVGYTSSMTGNRRTLNRCTTHAWNDAMLPHSATANLMRVQRSTLT